MEAVRVRPRSMDLPNSAATAFSTPTLCADTSPKRTTRRCRRVSMNTGKVPSGSVNTRRKNERLIWGDACNPALGMFVVDLFKWRRRLEARTYFFGHQLSVTMSSSSGCGAVSNTRRCICGPMTASARPAFRSAVISTSTTKGVHTRALTARHPIKPTSPRCQSAWQPNPGRGSTYRRGKSVQTTGTTSQHPDRPHVSVPQDDRTIFATLSYAELAKAARLVAAGLAASNIERGDRIALMLPTGADFFVPFFSILNAGGTFVGSMRTVPSKTWMTRMSMFCSSRCMAVASELARRHRIGRVLTGKQPASPVAAQCGTSCPEAQAVVATASRSDPCVPCLARRAASCLGVDVRHLPSETRRPAP